ncbi:hypothetical protein GCM10025863_26400 [Microbacterium suwonense]|jgi:hypothetical protein|uniref:Uncharacterized protein n=1 Tax=Microbacterium suwonense TaxID=683047 RepID=A0ABN6X5S8_9MICO|nr:hypothetical protein GCM10025863_26400 [Microbacterium suwonense]
MEPGVPWITTDLGYSQAPVVVVDEQDHWSGFQPDEIILVAPTVVELRIQRLPTLLPMNGGELITND